MFFGAHGVYILLTVFIGFVFLRLYYLYVCDMYVIGFGKRWRYFTFVDA